VKLIEGGRRRRRRRRMRERERERGGGVDAESFFARYLCRNRALGGQ
jgi:hypothetical protein